MDLTLYHYWRSSSSWRVRWALEHKKTACKLTPVNLLKNEQNSTEHLKRNPAGLVPCLEISNQGKTSYLSESVAIIEWLEETQAGPALLPKDAIDRARVRQLVQIINADIQPIQNLRVLQKHSSDQVQKNAWATHWIDLGFKAYEHICGDLHKTFSIGTEITMADLFLIPQCYNARRFDIDLERYPIINKIFNTAMATEACQKSAPENYQPKD